MPVKVKELVEKVKDFGIKLEVLCGKKSFNKEIINPRIQKPGLALTGFTYHLHPNRIQILGDTEITYIESLSKYKQKKAVKFIDDIDISCLIITKNLEIPDVLYKVACKNRVPLLRTSLQSSEFIQQIEEILNDLLAEETSLHGVLVDVFGIGILITGRSGIGKSELALDLVMRNHRLIADDLVKIKKKIPEVLIGFSDKIIRNMMEIRGLGIINLKDLFGVAATREQKRIELVVQLLDWTDDFEYERVGLDDAFYNILGMDVPLLKLPVTPGRNLTAIIEIAAKNHLLKLEGKDSAKEFSEKIGEKLKEVAHYFKEEIE